MMQKNPQKWFLVLTIILSLLLVVACQETAWGAADYYDQLKACARQVDADYPLPGAGQ